MFFRVPMTPTKSLPTLTLKPHHTHLLVTAQTPVRNPSRRCRRLFRRFRRS
ncbi:hypothetical protein HanIR_Chr06g0257561 [Helianthus annuus]|nr:hypothetical protein HanIR_Chr06g0257561 [Helianthus annuus]